MNKVRWGIIGCGNVTEAKSGPALSKIKDSQLVAVMRRNPAKARDYAERHNVTCWYDDATALIADDNVNSIYVATPPDTHADYAIMAMEAGKPVYVEKPMAIDFASCQRMLDVHERTNTPLFVAYYRRSLPSFLKVKDLLEQKLIGEPRLVRLHLFRPIHVALQTDPLPWRVLPHIAGGGLFVDLAPHQLDILDFLLGPIDRVQGIAANHAGLYPAEDIVCAQFTFASGILGSGTWCFTTAREQYGDSIEIIGSEGKIEFSVFGDMDVSWNTTNGQGTYTQPRPEHIQQPMLQDVVDTLLGRGSFPSTPHIAARTNRVIDDVLRLQDRFHKG